MADWLQGNAVGQTTGDNSIVVVTAVVVVVVVMVLMVVMVDRQSG